MNQTTIPGADHPRYIAVRSSNWSGSSTLVRSCLCVRTIVSTCLMSNRDKSKSSSSSGWTLFLMFGQFSSISYFLIRFNKESLTTLNLAVNSNWVFVGTLNGNTHVLRLGNNILYPCLTSPHLTKTFRLLQSVRLHHLLEQGDWSGDGVSPGTCQSYSW